MAQSWHNFTDLILFLSDSQLSTDNFHQNDTHRGILHTSSDRKLYHLADPKYIFDPRDEIQNCVFIELDINCESLKILEITWSCKAGTGWKCSYIYL